MNPESNVVSEQQWLTVREVAALLRVKPYTVDRLLHQKDAGLPGVYLGKHAGWRVSRDTLATWMQEHEGKTQ